MWQNRSATEPMTRNAWTFLVAATLSLFAETSWGQRTLNWRIYKVADGLAESACFSATISPQGKIVTKHFNPYASELDGYNVITTLTPEGAGRVYESPGGQFWTIDSGGLEEFKDGAWLTHPLPGLFPHSSGPR